MKRLHVRFEWKLEDLWLGVFWKHTNAKLPEGERPIATDVWICLLPCVPLHITYWRRVRVKD